MLTPFVIFQGLLCARDDYQLHGHGSNPSATEVVCPLLIFLGLIVLIATGVSATYKTAFEVSESCRCKFDMVHGVTLCCLVYVGSAS
jgi:hypothetical protein